MNADTTTMVILVMAMGSLVCWGWALVADAVRSMTPWGIRRENR